MLWMTAVFIFLSTVAPSALVAQALPQSPRLTLEAGRRIAAAAQIRAQAMNLRVVVAVLDEGGHPILVERMDGTQTASVEIALAKGRSAAAFKRPTREMASWVAGGEVALMALPGLLPVEGGIPIIVGGHVVGSVGVSGATAEEDGQIAQAGVAAIAGSASKSSRPPA